MAKKNTKTRGEIKDIPPDIYLAATLNEYRDPKDNTLYIWFGESDNHHSNFITGYVEKRETGFAGVLTRQLCKFFGEVPEKICAKEEDARKYVIQCFVKNMESLTATLKRTSK